VVAKIKKIIMGCSSYKDMNTEMGWNSGKDSKVGGHSPLAESWHLETLNKCNTFLQYLSIQRLVYRPAKRAADGRQMMDGGGERKKYLNQTCSHGISVQSLFAQGLTVST